MASKEKRGLPPGYDLNIPEPELNKPVQLGDYLDEVDRDNPQQPRPVSPKQRTEKKIIEMPRSSEKRDEVYRPASPEEANAGETKPSRKPRRKPAAPARKQINATPETLRMIEELIEHVRTYSAQKDAKASEVFHALVLALYEARESIDMSDVAARGRWGTPTAKAFPISLKNAFQEAIASAHKKNRR